MVFNEIILLPNCLVLIVLFLKLFINYVCPQHKNLATLFQRVIQGTKGFPLTLFRKPY